MKSVGYWKWAVTMLVAHLAFALVTWFSLPGRIPMHFNAAGVADAWVGKSLITWFGLVGASVFIFLLIYTLSRPEAMSSWNIPEKERFQKLTPEQQRPVLKLMSLFGAGTTAALVLLFLTLQVGMYLTAIGASGGGLPWYITAVMAAIPAGILLALFPWSKAVKQAILSADTAKPL